MASSPSLPEQMRSISTLLQSGQFTAARGQLEKIVESNPTFVEALRLLAGTRVALGDPVAAETLLRRALELEPDWTPTLTTLGELLLAGGRGSEAETVLQKAISGPRPDPRGALALARYYNGTGRAAQALAVITPWCSGRIVNADLAAQHVSALIALGRGEEAVNHYASRAGKSAHDPAAAHALTMALSATGQHAQAGRIASGLLAKGHRSAALHLTYARSLMAEGAADKAEDALRECLRLDPRLIEAHNSLAQRVWVRTGDLRQATQTLEEALRIFANDDALWAAKAAILQGAGDARGAYACLAPRAERPRASPVLLVRAALAALEFDSPAALSLAERALRTMPTNASARTVLAAAQLGVGDAGAALGQVEELLGQAPDDQYLLALYTTALRLLGDQRYGQLCDYANLVMPMTLQPPRPWGDLQGFLTDLRASLNRLHAPDGHALLFQSLRHGTETTEELTRSTDPAIRALFAAFAAPIGHYLERIGHGADPLRRRNGGRWKFNGSWSVRLRDRGFHMSHVHPRGWISSACYIELPEGMADERSEEGILSFGKPGILTTPALEPEHSVRPSPGMLVLFPSYFWHGTVPFKGPQVRMTVAFDAVPEK